MPEEKKPAEPKTEQKKDMKQEVVPVKAKVEQAPGPKQTKAEEAKKELLAKSEISLILDTYDDIFSDFDPRPYSQRGFSEDFIKEAKKGVSVAGKGNLQLGFMIPKAQKNADHEALIRKRLREFFKKYGEALEKEKKNAIYHGVLIALVGFSILMLATYVISLERDDFIYSFLIVILEPSGWFTAWTGLESIFSRSKEKDPEISFYRRMGKAEVTFMEY